MPNGVVTRRAETFPSERLCGRGPGWLLETAGRAPLGRKKGRGERLGERAGAAGGRVGRGPAKNGMGPKPHQAP